MGANPSVQQHSHGFMQPSTGLLSAWPAWQRHVTNVAAAAAAQVQAQVQGSRVLLAPPASLSHGWAPLQVRPPATATSAARLCRWGAPRSSLTAERALTGSCRRQTWTWLRFKGERAGLREHASGNSSKQRQSFHIGAVNTDRAVQGWFLPQPLTTACRVAGRSAVAVPRWLTSFLPSPLCLF